MPVPSKSGPSSGSRKQSGRKQKDYGGKYLWKRWVFSLEWKVEGDHHQIYFPIITQQYHKNSHTIGGLPEKPYSSLTGRPVKKNKLSTNTIRVQTENKKQQHCAGAIGHEQYRHFIYIIQ